MSYTELVKPMRRRLDFLQLFHCNGEVNRDYAYTFSRFITGTRPLPGSRQEFCATLLSSIQAR